MEEYIGIRTRDNGYISDTLYLLDLEDVDGAVEDIRKYSGEFTYAEWDRKNHRYKEALKITDMKIWLLPII